MWLRPGLLGCGLSQVQGLLPCFTWVCASAKLCMSRVLSESDGTRMEGNLPANPPVKWITLPRRTEQDTLWFPKVRSSYTSFLFLPFFFAS